MDACPPVPLRLEVAPPYQLAQAGEMAVFAVATIDPQPVAHQWIFKGNPLLKMHCEMVGTSSQELKMFGTLTGLPGTVLAAEVRLNLIEDHDEGNNGDLYACLSHGGQLIVLLNRVGRASGNEVRFPGQGFSGTLLRRQLRAWRCRPNT